MRNGVGQNTLSEVVFAYNSTPQSSTGYSPYYLLFGRDPRLPVDMLLGEQEQNDQGTVDDWLCMHQKRLGVAFNKAGERMQKKAESRAELHQKKEYVVPIKVGHRVLLRNRPKGRNKIQDAWSSKVYLVVDVTEDEKGYLVEPADGSGVPKRVNRREVRPCLFSVEEPEVVTDEEVSDESDDSSETQSSSQESGRWALRSHSRQLRPSPARRRPEKPVEKPPQLRSARSNKGCHPNPTRQPRSVLPVDSVIGWTDFPIQTSI